MAASWETIKVDGSDMRMYLSVPDGSGPFPAVLVSQHGPGVNEFIQDIANNLAKEGYVACAPELYHRVTEEMLADGSGPGDYNNDIDTITDLNATVEYLRSHPSVDGERLGITGFCAGGRTTWLGAATNSHFKAAVPFFGGNIMVSRGNIDQSPFDRTSGMKCPVLFHFGGIDTNPSPEDQAKYDAELTRLGIPHEFYSYPGADHAFMDYNRDRYQKEASDVAWPRTLEFFAIHLKRAVVR